MKKEIITTSGKVFELNQDTDFVIIMQQHIKMKNGRCPRKQDGINPVCVCDNLLNKNTCICGLYVEKEN